MNGVSGAPLRRAEVPDMIEIKDEHEAYRWHTDGRLEQQVFVPYEGLYVPGFFRVIGRIYERPSVFMCRAMSNAFCEGQALGQQQGAAEMRKTFRNSLSQLLGVTLESNEVEEIDGRTGN